MNHGLINYLGHVVHTIIVWFLFFCIVVRPEMTVPNVQFVVNQTDPVTFVCTATGIPAPTIQWYIGSMLVNGTNSRITVNDTVFSMPVGDVASVGSSLTIDSTLGSDSGTYRCVATNNLINIDDMEIGIDEENVTLFVQGKPCAYSDAERSALVRSNSILGYMLIINTDDSQC